MALAGVHSMAQATKGQTKAGTAGKKTERVLVHQKGGWPEDHLDRPWMDGIPSKAPGRTAASPEQTLDHLEWSNSKVQQCNHAICKVHVTEKRGQPPGPKDPSWMDGVPSKAPCVPAGSPEQTLDHLEWSNSKAGQVPHAGGDRRGAQGFPLKRSRRQAEEVPHHQRLWEGGFCCGIANCHNQRCDPTGLVITSVFATSVIRLVWGSPTL